MKYKIIFSDYDGTLTVGETVPKETIDAIKEYQKAGGIFVVCSGRPLYSQEYIERQNGFKADANIACQGSVIKVGDKIIKNDGIQSENATELVKILEDLGREYTCFVDGDLYYHGNSIWMDKYLEYFKGTIVKVDDFLTNPKTAFGKYEKLLIIKKPDEDMSGIIKIINERLPGKVVMNSGASIILEVVDAKSTKYEACKALANYLNIPEEETITVGDSTNDLTLVKFGLGLAVEDGHEDLKKVAKGIVPPVNDKPIKQIIEKLLRGEEPIF